MAKRQDDAREKKPSPYPPGLAIGAGLVIGAGLGISLGTTFGDTAMGLVYGAAAGLIMGAIVDGFIRRVHSQQRERDR